MEGGDNQAISNSGVVEILSYLYQEMKARDWTDKWIDEETNSANENCFHGDGRVRNRFI